MIEVAQALSALGIALIGSFLLFWLTIFLVIATLWAIPFAILCLFEVAAMFRDVCLGLMRPFIWLANLIGKRNVKRTNHLAIRGLSLHDGRGYDLPRLPTGRTHRGPGNSTAIEFLRL